MVNMPRYRNSSSMILIRRTVTLLFYQVYVSGHQQEIYDIEGNKIYKIRDKEFITLKGVNLQNKRQGI